MLLTSHFRVYELLDPSHLVTDKKSLSAVVGFKNVFKALEKHWCSGFGILLHLRLKQKMNENR